MIAFVPMVALLVDRLLGEPRHHHPLVIFGRCAETVEKRIADVNALSTQQRMRGFFAALVLLLPTCFLAWCLSSVPVLGVLFSVIILYGCIGLQSLHEHAQAVIAALSANNSNAARKAVSMIVSRDTEQMDELQISRATIESVLENGNDAVFATLFWFFVLGAPGAVLLRAANTLDAMWGYKTDRYLHFGFFAARFDDVLNWIPARLTALTYALLGNTARALRCWSAQAAYCASPNGGPVMTAGAGSLGVTLGGGAFYHGVWQEKPVMGEGGEPKSVDIVRALQLVKRSAWLWVIAYALIAVVLHA